LLGCAAAQSTAAIRRFAVVCGASIIHGDTSMSARIAIPISAASPTLPESPRYAKPVGDANRRLGDS
jgi:hypothetical protein